MHPDALGKVSQVQFQPGTENRRAALKFCSPCSSQSHERALFQQTLNRERCRVYTVVWVKMRIELTSPKQKNSDRILKTAKQQNSNLPPEGLPLRYKALRKRTDKNFTPQLPDIFPINHPKPILSPTTTEFQPHQGEHQLHPSQNPSLQGTNISR